MRINPINDKDFVAKTPRWICVGINADIELPLVLKTFDNILSRIVKDKEEEHWIIYLNFIDISNFDKVKNILENVQIYLETATIVKYFTLFMDMKIIKNSIIDWDWVRRTVPYGLSLSFRILNRFDNVQQELSVFENYKSTIFPNPQSAVCIGYELTGNLQKDIQNMSYIFDFGFNKLILTDCYTYNTVELDDSIINELPDILTWFENSIYMQQPCYMFPLSATPLLNNLLIEKDATENVLVFELDSLGNVYKCERARQLNKTIGNIDAGIDMDEYVKNVRLCDGCRLAHGCFSGCELEKYFDVDTKRKNLKNRFITALNNKNIFRMSKE